MLHKQDIESVELPYTADFSLAVPAPTIAGPRKDARLSDHQTSFSVGQR